MKKLMIFELLILALLSITTRHFKAEYSCIASSGIGVMASAGSLIMP